ncbi:MAG: endolytic transglycosylase MltG [Elusimicrobia bacterium]|nr:endolytic transglycosylase MltG [Elusimicrobiota bacterium]
MARRKLLYWVTLLCLLVFLVGSVYYTPYTERIIAIEPGMNAKEVALLLKEEQMIRSPYLFMAYTRYKKLGHKLRPGCYDLNSDLSFAALLEKISKGETYGVKVTIPEGYTSRQIASLLSTKKLVNRDQFLQIVREKGLEGYLYPATYAILPGTRTEAIAQMMVEKFNYVFGDQLLEQCDKLKLTQRQILILASIIEKEAKISAEKPEVAAVFYNRLKKKWLLESCATVQYAWGKTKPFLSRSDLKIKSSYNTYQNPGLPPGPICNPGLASIKAALYPDNSDNMFFISKGNGTHKFSRYYREHLKEKQLLKKKS